MFTSIMNTINGTLTIESLLLCTGASLLFGFIISFLYLSSGKYTKNFAVTLVLMPALVQMVIITVNGNLGTGVAVLGTFSLVRFRSVPGSSKEISCIFFAMAIGLATGMGQLLFAAVLVVIIGIVMFLLNRCRYGEGNLKVKNLKITIPESLNYTDVFDDLFSKYTKTASLEKVKTTNLGSLLELEYEIELRNEKQEKEFIDAVRCRNGNLTITCSRIHSTGLEL